MGEVLGKAQKVEECGDVFLIVARTMGVKEFPNQFVFSVDFESPTAVRFADEGIAVGEALCGAAGGGVEGVGCIPSVLPDAFPGVDIVFQYAGCISAAFVIKDEQVAIVDDFGVMLGTEVAAEAPGD